MKPWHEIKSEFNKDGSLRDIYVEHINSKTWESFIESLKKSNFRFRFKHGEAEITLPDTLKEIKQLQETNPTILSVLVSKGIKINCHFFIESEIELDISPSYIKDELSYLKLIEFMQWLSSEVSKEVKLTHENSQQQVILSIYE